jgi:glycosyltransferase involved in cell wall biosynthesis
MKIVLDLQGAQSESSRFRGIGRYSLALARAIVREAKQHEIWLALNGRYLESVIRLREEFANLIPEERIRVFALPGPVAELDPRNAWRMKTAELIREKFLSDLRPDILHISTMFEGFQNEVVTSVGRLTKEVPTAVTLYDLIPLLHQERLLPDAVGKRIYLRRAQSLKRADILLAISESTRREAIKVLGIAPERIVTIGAGLEESLRTRVDVTSNARTQIASRYGLHRPFVFYAGAVDPHKNVEGLMAAFALLPERLRRSHHLVFAGKLRDEDRKRLVSLAKQHGFGDDFFCLGYVPDADLRLLYALCAVFVFPSLHEGFGLPILEAMACGAPVIASSCTSIPEIIDRGDALFDPLQSTEIADRMAKVLSNAEFRHDLKAWGSETAKTFIWEECARKALRTFEDLANRRKAQPAAILNATATLRRPLLAFVSPLPPSHCPTAGYSARLLPDLSRHYEIVCIVENLEVTDPWISANFEIRDLEWFELNASKFERIVYQLGNTPSCKHVSNLLQRFPGIVVLHDFPIGELLNWIEESEGPADCFVKALYDSSGFSALQRDSSEGREFSIKAYPCNAPVLRESIGIIVHSDEAIDQIRDWYGAKIPTVIRQIPYPDFCEKSPLNNLAFGQHYERPAFPHRVHPERVATLYRDAIEDIYSTSFQAREQELLRAIARTEAPAAPTESDLGALALAIASNRVPFGPRQILVDVTILARKDVRTGIQRVTRAILMALIRNPPADYRIEPVRASDGKYFYARRFTCHCLSLPDDKLSDDQVETRNGDIFLGLDLCFEFVPDMVPWFELQRCRGVAINFVVYDILTQRRPELFYPHIAPAVRRWLETLARIADGLICISRTVADEVAEWLSNLEPQRKRPLSIGFFHLGADLHASLPTTGLTSDASSILNSIRCRPSFLMVGTVEPRKCHRQAVAAMEKLWESNTDANLVIAGKPGWLMEEFEKAIKTHPENGNHLFWLQDVSDEMLEQLYRSAAALLVTSEGEGFGLPLIEAAQFGLPIVARDLPVFREVAGESAYYFSGSNPEDLADALRRWLALGDAAPKSSDIPWLTWEQSGRQLLGTLLARRWYRYWPHKANDSSATAPIGATLGSTKSPIRSVSLMSGALEIK